MRVRDSYAHDHPLPPPSRSPEKKKKKILSLLTFCAVPVAASAARWFPKEPNGFLSSLEEKRHERPTARHPAGGAQRYLLFDFFMESRSLLYFFPQVPSTRKTRLECFSFFCTIIVFGFSSYPTNIGIVRCTVSVATIVVVSAGVEIWLL